MFGSSSFIIFWNCARSSDCAPQDHLSSGFDGESQANGFGDRDQCGQARISANRQGPVKTPTLDARSLGDFGDAPCLREMPQSKQNPRFILIFQRSFEILCGKVWVFSEPPNEGLVMGDAAFTFHEAPAYFHCNL